MSGCIKCPSSDHCNTCGKHDPADAEMERIKDFWTAIDKVLAHAPAAEAAEARLIAAIGLQAAVRIGHRQQDGRDARRLLFACTGPFDHTEFAGHVLRVGGVGDIDDCRTFIDRKLSEQEAQEKSCDTN